VYIALCGIDGSSKTTTINRIKKSNLDAIFTREPFNYEKIKTATKNMKDPHIRSYTMAIDRHCHMKDVIIPEKKAGKHIISDRCYLCSLAYQSYQGVNLEWLMSIQPLNLVFPDHVIWFQCDPKIAALRSGEGEDMLTGVQHTYGEILNSFDLPQVSWHPVNVDGKSEDEVYIEVAMLIEGLMRKHEQSF
jgi:dTMP kinase